MVHLMVRCVLWSEKYGKWCMISVRSFVGMFVYMLVISNDANFMSFVYGMSIRSCIRWVEFLTLYVYGKGVSLLMSVMSFFSQFIHWGLCPVDCLSDGGVFFVDFDKASDVRWRWVEVHYLPFFVFLY